MPEQPQSKRHLNRVPPHDLATERRLLGNALVWRQMGATALVAEMAPGDFYMPSHKTIADTIRRMVAAGMVVDAGTVASELRRAGQLDEIGDRNIRGGPYLVHLEAEAVHSQATPQLVDLVVDYARKRDVLGLAHEVTEAVYSGTDASGLIAELHDAAQAQELARHSTWEPVNLAAVLAGEGGETAPSFLVRSDGAPLLYPGKVHALAAEAESAKSWLAMLACLERIRCGEHALYVDFEDSAASVVERMLLLGATPAELLERFHYVRPDDPIDAGARLRVAEAVSAWPVTLAVVDGVTEAMVVSGWSIIDNDDVARFYASLPRALARHGVAVVLIDHVVKDRDSRGRHPIGGQHKLAGIDGAAYTLEVTKPFGRGRVGTARLVVTKDRPGFVRAVATGGRLVGEFVLRSDENVVVAEVRAPAGDVGPFRPTGYMERVSRELEGRDDGLSGNQIERAVRGRAAVIREALQLLVEEHYVAREPGRGKAWLFRSLRPFREESESDQQTLGTEKEPWATEDF